MTPDPLPGTSLADPLLLYMRLIPRMIDEIEDYAIILLDAKGHVLHWNKGAEQIKGYAAEEIIGHHFRTFYTEDDRTGGLPEQLLELSRKAGSAAYEGWRVRKDGSQFWGSIVITAIHDEKGQVIGFTKVTRDLTERKLAAEKEAAYTRELETMNHQLRALHGELEMRVMELNRTNQDLQGFVHMVTLDLKAPLRKVETYVSLLFQEQASLSPRSQELRQRIERTLQRARHLINDLLSLATVHEDIALEPVALDEVLAEVQGELEATIREKQGQLHIDPLPIVKGNRTYLIQLFTNLLENALKYNRNIPEIHVSATTEDQEVIVAVQDNGIGIATEDHDRIFRSFERLHSAGDFEGNGIGLAICKKIVEVLGGNVTLTSRPGVGTTFYVRLALA